MITIKEIYTSSGPRWSDITPDKICDELSNAIKLTRNFQVKRQANSFYNGNPRGKY